MKRKTILNATRILCIFLLMPVVCSTGALADTSFTATGAVNAGDVVVVDSAVDSGVATTATEADTHVIGISQTTVGAGGGSIYVRQHGGQVAVNVAGVVTRGQFLVTSTTAGKAKAVDGLQGGVFAVAITADGMPQGGQCYASLYPGFQDGMGNDNTVDGLVHDAADPTDGDVWTYDDVSGDMLLAQPPGSGGGEANTASNQGVDGVGLFDSKIGVDLGFRNINAAGDKVTVTLDSENKEVDIDVSETNFDASLTRDTEWDSESEIETAWSGANIIVSMEIDSETELESLLADVSDVYTTNDSGVTLDTEWDSEGEIESAISDNIIVDGEIDSEGEIESLISDDIIVDGEIDSESELETIVGANFAKATGDDYTGDQDFSGADLLKLPVGTSLTLDEAGGAGIDSDADGDLIDIPWMEFTGDGATAVISVPLRKALITDLINYSPIIYDASNDEFVVGTQYGELSGGTRYIYVNGSSGSDNNLGTSASPLQTIQKAWDVIPPIVTEPIIIKIVYAGTYSEALVFSYKVMGSSTASITVTGEDAMTEVDTGTADADCDVETVEDDGQGWTPSAHAGQLCYVVNNSQGCWIRDNDADTLNLGGKLVTDPDSTGFTINTLGVTVSPGAGNIGVDMVNQAGVTIQYIKFSGGTHGIRANNAIANVKWCEFTTQTNTGIYNYGGGSSLVLTGNYIHAAAIMGTSTSDGAQVNHNGSYILGCNTAGYSVYGGIMVQDNGVCYMSRSYIDGNDKNGIRLRRGAQWRGPTGSATISIITNHDTTGDYGVYAEDGAHGIDITSQDFPIGTNDTDYDAEAGSYANNT